MDQHNRLIAFNAITGLFDTPTQSERTVWIEDDAKDAFGAGYVSSLGIDFGKIHSGAHT